MTTYYVVEQFHRGTWKTIFRTSDREELARELPRIRAAAPGERFRTRRIREKHRIRKRVRR